MSEAMELLRKKTGIVKQPKTIADTLEDLKPQLARVMSKSVDPDRLVRIALTEMRKNPELAKCDVNSVMGCVMIAATMNLEFGVFGQCYMVPFKGHAQFIPGWQGWADLVSRSGRATVWTGVVREGDNFECSLGSNPFIKHEPDFDLDEDAPWKYVYAVGMIKGSDHPIIEVWGKSKVEKHLKRYNKVGDRHYAKKDSHNLEMYARKLPLLQVIKYLPKSAEVRAAASLEYAADAGVQRPTISMASSILDNPIEIDDGVHNNALPGASSEVVELFDILGYSEEKRASLVAKYEGNYGELENFLKGELD